MGQDIELISISSYRNRHRWYDWLISHAPSVYILAPLMGIIIGLMIR